MNETKFTADKNVLTIRRTFDAPISVVWRAWTEAELLDQWWAPEPWKSQTSRMEFMIGGERLYAMVGPEGEEHWGLTTYKTVELQKSFSGEDAFCDNEGNVNIDLPVSNFQNQFKSETEKTVVIVITEYASEESLKQIIEMGLKEGLTIAYKKLDEVLNNLKNS